MEIESCHYKMHNWVLFWTIPVEYTFHDLHSKQRRGPVFSAPASHSRYLESIFRPGDS
jgi:hypothetical protein